MFLDSTRQRSCFCFIIHEKFKHYQAHSKAASSMSRNVKLSSELTANWRHAVNLNLDTIEEWRWKKWNGKNARMIRLVKLMPSQPDILVYTLRVSLSCVLCEGISHLSVASQLVSSAWQNGCVRRQRSFVIKNCDMGRERERGIELFCGTFIHKNSWKYLFLSASFSH